MKDAFHRSMGKWALYGINKHVNIIQGNNNFNFFWIISFFIEYVKIYMLIYLLNRPFSVEYRTTLTYRYSFI